jgi:hypothetical protein
MEDSLVDEALNVNGDLAVSAVVNHRFCCGLNRSRTRPEWAKSLILLEAGSGIEPLWTALQAAA